MPSRPRKELSPHPARIPLAPQGIGKAVDDPSSLFLARGMKAILLSLFVALLMVGCGGLDLDDPETLDKIIAEAIEGTSLQKRGKKGEELA